MQVRLRKSKIEAMILQQYRYKADFAAAIGWSRQFVSDLLCREDAAKISVGSVLRLCQILSTPKNPLQIEDLVEVKPVS